MCCACRAGLLTWTARFRLLPRVVRFASGEAAGSPASAVLSASTNACWRQSPHHPGVPGCLRWTLPGTVCDLERNGAMGVIWPDATSAEVHAGAAGASCAVKVDGQRRGRLLALKKRLTVSSAGGSGSRVHFNLLASARTEQASPPEKVRRSRG